MNLIDPKSYDTTITKLRSFFKDRGFLEVPVQSRLSILAACEDPRTLSTFEYAGNRWPLPQTGQMWLEYELLKNPGTPGFFCISTSYRQEPNPIPGRHDLIFPMFEFEFPGTMTDLRKMEEDLLAHLGFGKPAFIQYEEAAKKYGVKELAAEHEEALDRDLGHAVFLENFPEYTSPFWNMKRNAKRADISNKIDVLLHGVETIGSAERATDPAAMSELFHTISGGGYADILYSKFGKDRVEAELKEFLANDFFDRVGGGIGVTRMIRALGLSGLL